MLKIRLSRIGGKQKPFYRVVVVEERSKRTGTYVELLGTYNPLSKPKEIKLNQERIDYWIKQGAQPSDGYLRIIGKAKQRPPRKAKKAPKEEPKAPVVAETPAAEPVAEEVTPETVEPEVSTQEETPVEEVTTEEIKPEETKDEGTA